MMSLLSGFDSWEPLLPHLKRYADSNIGKLVSYERKDVRICAPVPRPGKIMVMAGNSGSIRDWPAEKRRRIYPEWVLKAPSCVVGQDDAVELPPKGFNNVTIPELELGIIVGRRARWVARDDAYGVVAGYTIFNDVTASDLIRDRMATLTPEEYYKTDLEAFHTPPSFNRIEMKCWDTFAPMGPCMVTKDEIPDPHVLTSYISINGTKVRESQKLDLLWDVPEIIHKFSMIMTIEPGDAFSTSSIIAGRVPVEYVLKPGYVMELTIPEIGTLRNHVVESKYPAAW